MGRQQNVFLGVVPRLASVPGCARRRLTFFCFAKRKQAKKKRAEVRAASRCLALLASDGIGRAASGESAFNQNAADLALPVRQRWPLGVTR
jgi:hypothetical protein